MKSFITSHSDSFNWQASEVRGTTWGSTIETQGYQYNLDVHKFFRRFRER